ncbi:MAG: response regulator transcription factor [Candidatus Limiplasma sp.]|nr:response regulator transcription factor [Candidatus Limiplasma sp.]
MEPDSSTILVVDDEERIVEIVESYLLKSNYAVLKAYNGTEALRLFHSNPVALVVLDLMLPDISGEEVCKTIRKTSRLPILMLTAKAEEEQVLKGLDIGADDYVTKPFSPRQLMARIGALLRRAQGEDYRVSSILSFNRQELVIDTLRHEVTKNGVRISLTPIEFNLLSTMAKTPSRIYTRDDLIQFALGDAYDGFDRSLDSHIKNLRHKIETDTKNCKYILTVHGLGYKFGGE